MRKTWSLVVGVACMAIPGPLMAQACIGSHAPQGTGVIAPSVSFTEDAFTYGGRVGGNFRGPVFASANYGRTDFDDTDIDANSLGGTLGFEASGVEDVSPCLVLGGAYVWAEEIDVDGYAFSGDLAIGGSIGEEFMVTPAASLGGVWRNVEDDSEAALGLGGSVTFGTEQVFLGVGVNWTTFEDADPSFGATLGFVL